MPMTNTARAFWIRSPGVGEIVPSELGPAGPGRVLVRAAFSAISRGTESLVYRGRVPASQHEVMRAPFQEGRFPAPLKYGYASVGRVVKDSEAGAAPPPRELDGRWVFCLHPHQDLYRVPATAVTPLPDGLPPGRAVLAAAMETAVNGVWDGRPAVGDRVVVIGGGVIGLLAAWLCRRIPGTEVTVVDVDPGREPVARALGLRLTTDPPPEGSADLVIHASGEPEGLRVALGAAGDEATVLELSWYGDRAVELPLGEAFHHRRLRIQSSQVSRLSPERVPRWDAARRMELGLTLLRDDSRLDHLVSGESDFDELPRVMDELSRSGSRALCHRIRYPDG